MCRPRRYSRSEALEIGRACLEARALKLPWKYLQRRYDLGRTRLFQFAKRAEAERLKSVHEQLGAGQSGLAGDNVAPLPRRRA